RGDILVRQEDLQGALDAYHHSLSCDDAAPEIRMEIAELYRHRGDPRRALSTLQRLADFYDLDEKPWRIDELEGLAYQALDRHDEAVEHFEAAAARGEPSGALLLAMAKSQLALGHWEHARYSAEQARERQPELAAAADRVLGQMAVARSQPQAGVHR
ncbi:MAG: tetratricopeptide repeat protein, partial [Planctomycetales bacterium]|nr:tetratricopeptide repeat protein [Planctomycetales bacterium]